MGCCDKRTTLRKALAQADAIEIGLAQALTKSELEKAAGCPAGQHKHAPYDYCHPTDRKHRGYTDEEPSGDVDAAHAVIDQEIVEARASGAAETAKILESAKTLLGRENPTKALMVLSDAADKLGDYASRWGKSPNMHIRARALALKKTEKVLRRAAKKLAPAAAETATTEPAKGGSAVGHGDIQQMSDEELVDHDKKLRNYIEQQEAAGKEVSPAFFERGKAVRAERQRRAAAGGEAQTGHPERGKKVLDELKGKIKEVDKRAKNAPPGSRARARAKASLQSLKEVEGKVRAQLKRQENEKAGREARERREATAPGAGTEWQRRPGAGRADM